MAPWVAIVGTRESGKQGLVESLGRALAARGLRLGGVIQSPVMRDGEAVGYDVLHVGGPERLPLARPAGEPRICNWGFDAEAFEAARTWVLEAPGDAAVVEVGRLEAAGEGHWPTVQAALAREDRLVVLLLRPAVAASVGLRLPDPVAGIELPASVEEAASFVEDVAREVASRRGRRSTAHASGST